MARNDADAIRRLKHEYCHTIDAGAYEEWVSLFTEDGRFRQYDVAVHAGHEELAAFATETFDPAYEHTAHVVTNPVVDVADAGETATGRWYMLLFYRDAEGAVGWKQGAYEDRFRRVDGEWRIAEVDLAAGVTSEG